MFASCDVTPGLDLFFFTLSLPYVAVGVTRSIEY